MFKNHPKGLPVLFFTELWERLGFYLIIGIFVLFMTDNLPYGLGLSTKDAADIYGTYVALVYLTPFFGGLLADRYLGYIKSIYIGGVLMGLGYIGLSIPGKTFFLPSLACIIIGNGFFKPNISTLVGNLYSTDEYKKLKDSGFNIFYMGINIGAFLSNFIAAYLRNAYGWGYAFAAAGIGMFIGLIWFSFGQKHIKHADVRKPMGKNDMSLGKISLTIFVPALIAAIIGWFLPTMMVGHSISGSHSTDAFLFASVPIAYFFISLWYKAEKEDKAPMASLLSIYAIVIVFWAIFYQNGAALTIWARDYSARELPALVEPAVSALGITEEVYTKNYRISEYSAAKGDTIITFIPSYLVVQEKSDSSKITYHKITKTGEEESILLKNKNLLKDAPNPYFKNYDKAALANIPADKGIKLISTELFQSVNPFFVVTLTPLLVVFFGFLRNRKKEPSTPAKIAWGLVITAVSTVVMMLAVLAAGNGATKSSSLWLFFSYVFIAIGEIFLSPMGLSLVSKLSPARFTALMMGGWFLANSIGSKLSGFLSGLWDTYDNKIFFFVINFIGAFAAAIAIFVMLKWLKRVIFEHTGTE